MVSDGPFSATSRCVHVRLIEIFVLDIYNTFHWVNSSLYGESRRYLISKIASGNSPSTAESEVILAPGHVFGTSLV